MPFIDANEMVKGSPLQGWSGRFFHAENMTFARWDISADAADLHEHHHPEEEVWNIVDGKLILVLDGEEREVPAGAAVVVPPNTPHSVKTLGPCIALVTDYPVRRQLPGVPTD